MTVSDKCEDIADYLKLKWEFEYYGRKHLISGSAIFKWGIERICMIIMSDRESSLHHADMGIRSTADRAGFIKYASTGFREISVGEGHFRAH